MEDKEAVEARHRKERRELQNKIQTLKKSATKGDKKKKREVTEEIALLEKELDERQSQELIQVQQHDEDNQEIESLLEVLESTSLQTNSKEVPQKVSKAQKRRQKKAEQERERNREIAQQEKLNVHGVRNVEIQKMKAVLKARNLVVHEIASDGNCLYCAVDHQLSQVGGAAVGVSRLRTLTRDFLLSHSPDFLPFMSHPESGDPLEEQQFLEYCDKVASTNAWGGEVELRALSQVLQRRIEVVQAEGPVVLLGDEFPPHTTLTIAFHRHMFGLGAHYNSVRTFQEPQDETLGTVA